jgi:1,4-dihydroxy-2-naphthoyl-CoA hydrolase
MTKPIWFGEPPERLKSTSSKDTLLTHLGIEMLESGPDFVRGRMPVDARTHQPFGLLHGGASVVLAESLASIGSAAIIDLGKNLCVGLEINANHLRGVKSGWVTGTARPLHLGRTTHVWDIRIVDEADKLVCVSRCTVAIIDNPARADTPSEAKP